MQSAGEAVGDSTVPVTLAAETAGDVPSPSMATVLAAPIAPTSFRLLNTVAYLLPPSDALKGQRRDHKSA